LSELVTQAADRSAGVGKRVVTRDFVTQCTFLLIFYT
jgi:hypothetical protein